MTNEIKRLTIPLTKSTIYSKPASFFSPKNIAYYSTASIANERIKRYQVKVLPYLSSQSRVILPISMERYDGNAGKRQQYDREVDALLRFTAEGLERGDIGRVDILSAAGLQEITWGSKKSKEIEGYFLDVHQKLLKRQSNFYTWDEFSESIGRERLADKYQMVKTDSTDGTEWHELMLMANKNLRIGSDIEKSLEYQRWEYAAVLSMENRYTNIAYMGNPSLAWAYTYKLYIEQNLPVCTRAVVEISHKRVHRSAHEELKFAGETIRNMESIFLDSPAKVREKFVDDMLRVYYTLGLKRKNKGEHSENPKKSENSEDSGNSDGSAKNLLTM